MRLVLLAFVFLSFCLKAGATTLRSGEHADFSRIVIELPQVSNWQISAGEGYYIFSSPALQQPQRIDDVFTLIPRTRVSDIEFDAKRRALLFRLGCEECHLDAFEIRAGRVVLDFKDGPDPNPTPAVTANTESFRQEDDRSSVSRNTQQSGKDLVPDIRGYILSEKTFLRRSQARDVAFARREADAEIRRLEESLSGGLAGLEGASPQPGQPGPSDAPRDPQAVVQSDPAAESQNSQIGSAPSQTLARVQTSPGQRDASECALPVRAVALPTEVSIGSLGALNSKLFNDLDRLDEDVATDLAATFLALGFVVEAQSALALIKEPDAEDLYLQALVDVISGKDSAAADVFGADDCDVGPEIWRVLSGSIENPLPNETADAIVMQFYELPLQLRFLVGPRVAARLQTGGREPQAERIANNLSTLRPDQGFLAYQENPTTGSSEALRLENQTLRTSALAANKDGQDALLLVLESATQNKQAISDKDLQYIDAVFYQYRHEETGQKLAHAKLRYALRLGRSDLIVDSLEQSFGSTNQIDPLLIHSIFSELPGSDEAFNRLLISSFFSNWGGIVKKSGDSATEGTPVLDWLKENREINADSLSQDLPRSNERKSVSDIERVTKAPENESHTKTLESKIEEIGSLLAGLEGRR